MKPKSVCCVYLVFGDSHINSGLKLLNAFFKRVFPNFNVNILVVANHLDSNSSHTSRSLWDFEGKSYPLISGDNSEREFSGYDLGLSKLESYFELSNQDWVLVCNDTFHRSYGDDYLNLFDHSTIAKHEKNNTSPIIGWLDAYPRMVRINESSFQSWIRSSFLLSRYQSFKSLGSLARDVVSQNVFSLDDDEFLSPDHKSLCDRYKNYIHAWLFNSPSEKKFKARWYGAQKLENSEKREMIRKTKSIFREHHLSIRARQLHVGIQAINKVPLMVRDYSPLKQLHQLCQMPFRGGVGS